MLDEAGCEEFVPNSHPLALMSIGAVGPRRDSGAVRGGTVILTGSRGQEPKSVEDFENASDSPARTSHNWVMTVGVQPRPRESKYDFSPVRWQAVPYVWIARALVGAQSFEHGR